MLTSATHDAGMGRTSNHPASIELVSAILFAVTLVLLFHPYRGVWHDSVVYLGQSLALLHPEAFSHDLFFSYGSQAKYTLFPRAIAWLLQRHDSGTVFLWLTLTGLGAFVLASWLLLRRLLPEATRLPGLLAVILLPASYGTWGILSYGEPFLTGRSFGEPLVLASLAMLVYRRHMLALIFWCSAVAVHPLQALPAAVVAWGWLIQRDRRWLHLSWAVPFVLVACLLVPQLQFVTARMDPLWHQQVWQRNLVVYYSHSGPVDWYYLLKDAFVASIAAYHARGTLRKYLLAVLGASALLFGASLMLADLLHLAWPSALQLWRIHWLLHWSATAVLPWVFLKLWRTDPAGWPRMLIFASAVVLGLIPSGAHPLMPGIVLLYLAWPKLAGLLSTPLQKGLALLLGGLAMAYLYPELRILIPWGTAPAHVQWVDSMQQARVPALLAFVAGIVALKIWMGASNRSRWLCLPVLAIALLYAASHWDHRSQLQRAFTSTPTGGNPFGVEIRPDQQVVWLGNLLPAWSVLQRPYYIQQQQLSGIVFNRKTSIEGFRRRDLMHVMDAQGRDCRLVVLPNEPYASCKPDDTAVRMACARARGQLSYFILSYPLQTEARGTWLPGDKASGTYYLYACQDFYESPASTKNALAK